MKCIDDEIPFEIPKGWEWCRFSSICKTLTDGTHSTPHYTERGVPFISVKDMSSGYLDFTNTKFISESEHVELSKRCYPRKGDLLLSKVGTTGIPLIIDTDSEFSIFVSLALIKFTSITINKQFLIHLINSPLVQEQVKENTRGVGNKNWVLSAIAQTLILLPPLKEQSRIVDKIAEISPIVKRYSISQQKLDILNTNIHDILQKSILQEAIQGRLVPQFSEEGTAQDLLEQIRQEKQKLVKEGKFKKSALTYSVIYKGDDNKYYENNGKSITCIDEEIPFDIPISWEWCRLKSISNIIGGYAFDGKEIKSEIGVRVIKISDFNEFGWVNKNITRYNGNLTLEQYMLQKYDIIIAMTGGTVGKSYHINNIEEVMLLNQRVALIRTNKINSSYLNIVIKSHYIQDVISDCKNSTNDNISMSDIANFLIPLPPKSEQIRIVQKYEEAIASIMSR